MLMEMAVRGEAVHLGGAVVGLDAHGEARRRHLRAMIVIALDRLTQELRDALGRFRLVRRVVPFDRHEIDLVRRPGRRRSRTARIGHVGHDRIRR